MLGIRLNQRIYPEHSEGSRYIFLYYEHKIKLKNKFTEKYNIDKLVYFESFPSKFNAVKREKEIKGWRREKKIILICSLNPKFINLSQGWFISRDPSLRSG